MLSERCVHAIVDIASCTSCVDACPVSAWDLDDQALLLDTGLCDGCGLCAPACPEGAILSQQEIVIGQWNHRRIAICACEKQGMPTQKGVIPCVHAVGIQDLLFLHQRGISTWVVATADCEDCSRKPNVQLFERVDAINRSQQQGVLKRIHYSKKNIIAWQRIRDSLIERDGGPSLTRRGFFRQVVETGLSCSMYGFTLSDRANSEFTPPGEMLSKTDHSTRWPYQPIIDEQRCNGCDTCVRLCPHQAVQLQAIDGDSRYRLVAKQCTGCGICIDVCEQKAIHVMEWACQEREMLELKRFKCASCGNAVHVPIKSGENNGRYCRICAGSNHQKNLYQVLN